LVTVPVMVAADAEAYGADFTFGHFGMRGEPVECGAAVGVKVGDRSFQGILLALCAAGVIESDDGAGGFDAIVDFGAGDDEAVTREAHAGAERGARELKNVRVRKDAGVAALGSGSDDESAHDAASVGDIDVFGCDDHKPLLSDLEIPHSGGRRMPALSFPVS